jgi:hypothetical protein
LKKSLKDYFSEDFLKWCFASRIGIYFPPNFEAFDLLIPVRSVVGGVAKFFPILVSVKTMASFSKARDAFEAMKKKTQDMGEPVCLCLLFWVGLCKDAQLLTFLEDKSLTAHDIESFVERPAAMHKLVIFPQNDIYGIQHMIECTSELPNDVKNFLSAPFYSSLTSEELHDHDD